MLTAPRCLWPGILACVLTGCAGSYQAVPMPPPDPGSGEGHVTHVDLAADDDLRLHLHDGTVVSGTFMRIQGGSLLLRDVQAVSGSQDSFAELLQPEDVATEPVASYPLADIERIERLERDATGPVVGVLAAVGIIYLTYRLVSSAMSLELFEESR